MDNPEFVDFYHDAWRGFPTFDSDPGPELNQLRVKVTTTPIPEGLEGTLHLSWFDPIDRTSNDGVNIVDDDTENWTATEAEGGKQKDNKVAPAFKFGSKKLTFSDDEAFTTSNVRKAILEIPSEAFGDNLIVAAHPNEGAQDEYGFDPDGHSLLHDTRSEDDVLLGAPYRTSILYVAAWNGLKLPEAWKFNEANYKITTPAPDIASFDPLTEIPGYTGPGVGPAATEEGQDATSINVTPENQKLDGFTIEFDYDFVNKDNGNDGYVHAFKDGQALLTRLGFVGNSGVKFGDFEASILDINAMISTAGDITDFQHTPASGLTLDGKKINIPPFKEENIGGFMTGVKYGVELKDNLTDNVEPKDYDAADKNADGDNRDGNPEWEKVYNAIVENQKRSLETGNHMKVKETPETGGTFTVEIWHNGSSYKETSVELVGKVEQLDLQSHWGSGVMFYNMDVDKTFALENP